MFVGQLAETKVYPVDLSSRGGHASLGNFVQKGAIHLWNRNGKVFT